MDKPTRSARLPDGADPQYFSGPLPSVLDIDAKFGDMVKEARRATFSCDTVHRRMTQDALAQHVYVSEKTIRNIERGCGTTLGTAALIALTLGISLDDILKR